VAVYRCYYLDSADHIASADVIHCDTDAQAQSRADVLLAASGYPGIEVWDRSQVVYRARKSDAPSRAMAVLTPKLSDDPRDKLRAALNRAYPGTDDDRGRAYRTACRQWFEQLSEDERWATVTTTVAYEKGQHDKAAEIASQLPPAPRFPP